MAFERGHHQPERLGGREHQRGQPETPAEAIAAVPAWGGLDGDAGLAQDPDVPPGGPVADAQPVPEPLTTDARAVLDQLERQQRLRRRAYFVHDHSRTHIPEA
jgi:hypothetical protein